MPHFTSHNHGGEVYALARRMRTTPDKFCDFSSNANIFAYSLTEKLVRDTPYAFVHYPDTKAGDLVEAIAAHETIEPERILPGNGGAELIWLTLQALAPRKVLFLGPIFSEYVTACHAYEIPYQIITPPAENDFICTPENLEALWETDADLVVLCTPNNPAAVTYDNIHSVLHMLRAPRVLIDNSYREFLYGTESYAENHLHSYQSMARPGVSLFTLHSFTKFFCCPGIRLGYLMGDRTQIARIEALRPAWTVSPFAQHMGRLFLEHIDAYRETLPALFNAVTSMGRELRRLDCMNPERIFEGPGFLCCGLAPRYNAPGVYKALLNRRLIIRNCDTIPGMPPGYIRMQARPEEDAATLLSALETVYIDNM
jgi:threonine-phosphate decarboxylase